MDEINNHMVLDTTRFIDNVVLEWVLEKPYPKEIVVITTKTRYYQARLAWGALMNPYVNHKFN